MTTVISVRFRNGCKTYYFDPRDLTITPGTEVIVETSQGPEFVTCVEGNHEVADDAVVEPLRAVVRIATDNDRHTAAYNRSREKEAFDICQKNRHAAVTECFCHDLKGNCFTGSGCTCDHAMTICH